MGNSPEVTNDENSYVVLDVFCTIPGVPISNRYLAKITAVRAWRERPNFIATVTFNEVQKASAGKTLEKVIRSTSEIQVNAQATKLHLI